MELPEKARAGLTGRRVRNALRAPARILRNARFWWNDAVSEQEHVFVVGPPRSGTTLVKAVLQSHTRICGVEDETCSSSGGTTPDSAIPPCPIRRLKRFVRQADSITGLFDRFAEAVKAKAGATYFLEKTPEHALRLSFLVEHFPRSTFVFLVRDPRDGLRSARNFPGYWATLPDEDRTGGYLETWRRSVAAYEAHADASSVLRLRYEDLCRRPEKELRRVMERIGLEMEARQLSPSVYGARRDKRVDAHARLQEPITAASVGAWRDELSAGDVRRVERILGAEMRAFGYSPEHVDVK
jgi:hypothetical protein